jgi:DNA-binding transcriptional LysR family regulator
VEGTRRHGADGAQPRAPYPGGILIDQGLADKFLAEQLHPHLFEAACQAVGQPLTLRRHAGYDHGYYFIASLDHKSKTTCAGGLNWVTLATGRTLSRTAVPGWLARVKRATGDFRLRLVTGSIAEGATALEQGGADFLLSFTHPRLPLVLDDQRFEGMTLGTDELVAVSAPRPDGRPLHTLPGTARKPVPVLGYAPALALSQILQDGLGRSPRELHLHTVTESDFAESLHEQALQGVGLAWLPRGLVGNDLQGGRLVEADRKGTAIRFEIRLYRPRSARNELVQRIWAASQAA